MHSPAQLPAQENVSNAQRSPVNYSQGNDEAPSSAPRSIMQERQVSPNPAVPTKNEATKPVSWKDE